MLSSSPKAIFPLNLSISLSLVSRYSCLNGFPTTAFVQSIILLYVKEYSSAVVRFYALSTNLKFKRVSWKFLVKTSQWRSSSLSFKRVANTYYSIRFFVLLVSALRSFCFLSASDLHVAMNYSQISLLSWNFFSTSEIYSSRNLTSIISSSVITPLAAFSYSSLVFLGPSTLSGSGCFFSSR